MGSSNGSYPRAWFRLCFTIKANAGVGDDFLDVHFWIYHVPAIIGKHFSDRKIFWGNRSLGHFNP